MQQNLEESNTGSDLHPSSSHPGNIPDESLPSLPSIITFPALNTKEEFLESERYHARFARYAEDDKFNFTSGTFHAIEVKTEEELEMYNESEEETEGEYVIVEDAEKYQIIPAVEQDYNFKVDNLCWDISKSMNDLPVELFSVTGSK